VLPIAWFLEGRGVQIAMLVGANLLLAWGWDRRRRVGVLLPVGLRAEISQGWTMWIVPVVVLGLIGLQIAALLVG